MRRFSFIVTILLLTLVSCAESGIKEYRNDYQVAPERLTATFEGVESTRIELQELNSVWSAGDEVSVFYHSYSNLKYKFDGNSGDSAGTLSLVAGEQGEATLDKSYMLYPYSESNSLGEDGMLYTSLPAEQSYKANSYGVGGNILVAESTTSQFVLNNVCGWIRIQLTGDGEVVQSITLSSNKNEALAGDVAVNSSDAGYTLTSSGGSSITLDCGEGVTLSESVTEFYIGILPQGLEGGITVDIVTDQDSVSKSTYEAVVVERNHILPMTAFRLSGEEAVHSELRYTATALVEPNNTSAFNAAVAIVSNEWDEETGEGVITFDGELTMIGYEAFSNCTSLTSVTIPNSVTTIEERAFIGCSSLTSVTIGNSVTKIGIGVFCGCINLAEFKGKFAEDGGRCLIIDGVLNAFAFGCGVTEYTIPDSVTTIGDMALYNCDSLTSVTIPDSVTTIGVWAFYVCDSLTSVTIPDSVTTIGDSAFYYCSSLTSVYCEATTPPTLGDGYVFDDNAEGRKIYVPAESIEAYKAAEKWSKYAADIVGYDFETGEEVAISNKLFYTATALVEPYKASAFNAAIVSNEWDEATGEGVITFDGELTTIGDMAFDGCESLTSVTIPDSVTTIGNSAFYYCDSLTSVTIPDSVTTIGNQAFRDCHSLTSVTIPDSITTIGNSAFSGCRSLTSVTIPDSVTTIGVGVFVSCHSLAKFNGKFAADGGRCLIKDNTIIAYAEASGATYTIPDSVTTIGDYAFCNCYSLTSVTIPDSVTTIGDYAFNGCSILTSVTIPDSITTIGYEAFRYCYSLTSVYCEATTPPTLGDGYVFDDNAEGRKIYVPAESVEAYKAAAGWSVYATDIVGYNFETGEEVAISNKLFYTATALVKPRTSAINVSIVSNEWDETTGEGVITFDGELTTIGDGAFYSCDSLTSVTIPDSVTTIGDKAFSWCSSLTSVTIPDSVTTIGDEVFGVCSSLTSVTIGDSVTAIGNEAFRNCTSLTSVTIGDSVTTIGENAFYGCSSLTEFKGKFATEDGRCLVVNGELYAFAPAGIKDYTIPDSVTTIGDEAFYKCTSLTSVTIPDSITTIGDSAFYNCSSLTSVTIPDSVTTIGDEAFYSCRSLTSVTIPDSVTTIGDSAFCNCDSLTSVTIPDSVTMIGNGAFRDCDSLTNVTIGNSVTTIGEGAFESCSSLTSVTIPDSVTTIGGYAFNDCRSLTSVYITDIAAWCNISFGDYPLSYGADLYLNNELVTELTIPDSVTTIGDGAFAYCESLTSVTIPDSVTTIGDSAFSGCESLTSVTIGDSVTTIGNGVFYGCDSLTSVTIPDSVTSIGYQAFYDCGRLTSVTIPDSVTTIGERAFYSCGSLTSVTIPDSVTTIGDSAFSYCSSLTSVYCEATTPPTLSYYIFNHNASGRKIYVPAESVGAYKAAAYWRNYAADIVTYDFETGEVVE